MTYDNHLCHKTYFCKHMFQNRSHTMNWTDSEKVLDRRGQIDISFCLNTVWTLCIELSSKQDTF